MNISIVSGLAPLRTLSKPTTTLLHSSEPFQVQTEAFPSPAHCSPSFPRQQLSSTPAASALSLNYSRFTEWAWQKFCPAHNFFETRLPLSGMKYLPGLLLLANTLLAQDWRYSPLPTTGEAPPPRIDGTIAYDADTASLYLFGGQANDILNDLWRYSIPSKTWTRLEATGTLPTARLGHTLLFDDQRKRLIVFGGQGRGFFSDVWAFDLKTQRWSPLAPDNSGPSRRYGHSAILDTETNRMIISHGFTSSGRFDDTWAFDLASNQWSNVTPAGSRPLRRCLHHAVLDPASRQMYLYGGCASGFGPCPLGDLWAFDLRSNTWTEITGGVRPPVRQHYGISFDTRRKQLVVFGGSGPGLLGDTWLFTPSSRAWSSLPNLSEGPTPRLRHQGTYAPERGVSYFFGGSASSGNSSELWELRSGLAPIPRLAQNGVANAFSGRGEAIAPGEIVSLFGDSLGPDEGQSASLENGQLPRSLAGSSVEINGIAAPIFYSQTGQLNLQVPAELTTASAMVRVLRNGERSNELSVPVVPAHPGLFPTTWNQDGSINSTTNPATPGTIIVLYATGQGLNPTPGATTLLIANRPAELLYAAPIAGTIGLIQINARIPAGLSAGPSPILLRIGEAESQSGPVVHLRESP